jgi:hypothetical protein
MNCNFPDMFLSDKEGRSMVYDSKAFRLTERDAFLQSEQYMILKDFIQDIIPEIEKSNLQPRVKATLLLILDKNGQACQLLAGSPVPAPDHNRPRYVRQDKPKQSVKPKSAPALSSPNSDPIGQPQRVPQGPRQPSVPQNPYKQGLSKLKTRFLEPIDSLDAIYRAQSLPVELRGPSHGNMNQWKKTHELHTGGECRLCSYCLSVAAPDLDAPEPTPKLSRVTRRWICAVHHWGKYGEGTNIDDYLLSTFPDRAAEFGITSEVVYPTTLLPRPDPSSYVGMEGLDA